MEVVPEHGPVGAQEEPTDVLTAEQLPLAVFRHEPSESGEAPGDHRNVLVAQETVAVSVVLVEHLLPAPEEQIRG